jgi:hypothetical protein
MNIERRFVAVLGTAAKHILHGLRRALRAVALTFVITAIIVVAITEATAAFLTKSFPTGLTHLAAAALAISFGYAAAITVAIEEILRAIIKSVEIIVEEAEKVEKKAVEEIGVLARRAEQEAMHLGHGAVTDAGAIGRTAAGLVGGTIGGVEHEIRAVEHGIGSHLPGHNSAPAPVPASGGTAPTLPAGADQNH